LGRRVRQVLKRATRICQELANRGLAAKRGGASRLAGFCHGPANARFRKNCGKSTIFP
jgi:hypothetical protein